MIECEQLAFDGMPSRHDIVCSHCGFVLTPVLGDDAFWAAVFMQRHEDQCDG